ncbi:nuclear RNA export factor 2-like [Loxodonta africana]|uniref:nuclear RNA export factor 2-like n=1 Tax=Loxodonta africana TaxID=9785 RepID=UPI0030D3C902
MHSSTPSLNRSGIYEIRPEQGLKAQGIVTKLILFKEEEDTGVFHKEDMIVGLNKSALAFIRHHARSKFPSGVKYDEKCLQNLIKSLCSIPFNLIQSQCQKMHTKVFVKSASIAFELKKVNSMICNEDNGRMSLFVSPSTLPYSEQKGLKSGKVKLIKVTKIKGYEVPQQALDHQRLHSGPHMSDSSNSRADVMTHDIEMGPNLRNCMAESLQIHEENAPKLLSFNSSNNTSFKLVGLPNTMQKAPNLKSLNLSKNEVKSEGELDKVKALESEEMCADRNPLCTTFPDKSTNISSILELFPKLLHLDNHEVPLPIVFGIEASKKLPVCRVRRYYWVYDYGDRLGLLDAYHDEACFSLTLPFNPEDLIPSCLDKYSKGSRNIKKLKDPVLRVQLLKHTKHDIVDSLSVLPRTEHDISSLVVDMCVQTVSTCFLPDAGPEGRVEGMCQAHVRAFTRIFIATPSSNFSLCIVNDQLCVRDSSPIETQGAFFTPVPTPPPALYPPSPSSSRKWWQRSLPSLG